MATVVTSAGGIVYREAPGEPQILMIADRLGRWSFPKGMVQRGEDPAAVLEQLSLALTNKLLHAPTVQLAARDSEK